MDPSIVLSAIESAPSRVALPPMKPLAWVSLQPSMAAAAVKASSEAAPQLEEAEAVGEGGALLGHRLHAPIFALSS